MKRALLAALLALPSLAGCDPTFTALTAPPPTAVAEYDAAKAAVRLTQGIAFAIECTYQGYACASVKAQAVDPKIVHVLPAYLDLLAPAENTYNRKANRSVLVLVGDAPGETTLTISSDQGDRDLAVTILAPP